MAITGDGKTPDTAYLVHDYWELKEACSSTYAGNTNNIKYIKLANDIDCNTNAYSNDFEWEGINLYYDAVVVDLNLNNKSIKNVMIANDSFLFRGHNNNISYSKIHDGKILNIFCNSSKNIINGNSSDNVICCKLENLSMSINGTSLTSYAFSKCAIDCCAIYYVSYKLNDSIFVTEVKTPTFINSDFYFDITDCNHKFIYNYDFGDVVWNSCRFGGKIGGDFPTNNTGGNFVRASNCVFDIDISTRNYSSITYYIATKSTGVFNISKSHLGTKVSSGLTDVTSTEIKSATELMKKGFVVTDIRPATSTT